MNADKNLPYPRLSAPSAVKSFSSLESELQPPELTGTAVLPNGQTLGQVVSAAERWRSLYNPLRGMTLPRLSAMFDTATRGSHAELQWFFRYMERRFSILRSCIKRRQAAIGKLDWSIKIKDPLPQGVSEAQAEAQRQYLSDLSEGISNLQKALAHLSLAEFRGYAMLAKHRDESGAICELHWLPQWNLVRDGTAGDWYWNPRWQLGALATSLGADARIDPATVVYREEDLPVNELAAYCYVLINLALKDWSSFVETYGLPGAIVMMPPNIPQGREDEFRVSAQAVSEGASGALPSGSDVKFPTAGIRGSHPFKEFTDHLAEQVVLAATGGKLTMLNEATGIGGGQAGVHQDAFDELAQSEAGELCAILNEQLFKPELCCQFPGQPVAAYFHLASDQTEDVTALVDQAAKLKAAGWKVSTEQLADRIGWDLDEVAPPEPPAPDPAAMPPQIGPSTASEPPNADGLPVSGPPGSESGADSSQPASSDSSDPSEPSDTLPNRAPVLPPASPIARARLGRALAGDFAPIREKLARIMEIHDPDILRSKLTEFRASLDQLRHDLAADPAAAMVLADIMAQAMSQGMKGNRP